MEAGNDIGYCFQAPLEFTALREAGETPLGRHSPHHHQVIAGHAVGPKNVRNAEIDVRRKPSVELHLPVACLPAQLRCGEVEEGSLNLLLEFVRPVPGEE